MYYEYKFFVPHATLPYVRAILEAVCGGSDPFPSGHVDSVYYDTLDARFLQQCMGGAARKAKVRIRSYDDGPYTQLQLKGKDLSQVSKIKQRIAPLAGHDPVPWDCIAPVGERRGFDAIASEVAKVGMLVPALRVRYQRLRYRLHDQRITLDTDIEVWGLSPTIGTTQGYAVLPGHVLEVKTETPRPHLPLLGLVKLPPSSFSKYRQGFLNLKETSWNSY